MEGGFYPHGAAHKPQAPCRFLGFFTNFGQFVTAEFHKLRLYQPSALIQLQLVVIWKVRFGVFCSLQLNTHQPIVG